MKRHSKSWLLKHTLEIATVALAIATVWLAVETKRGLSKTIQVNSWIEIEKRFDSPEMKQRRAALAAQLDPYVPGKVDDSKLDVLDLFDDVGALWKQGFIDEKLTRSSFSWYVNDWWAASKDYIADERKADGDSSEYAEFEYLATAMRSADPTITTNDVRDFLASEKRLAEKPQK